MTTQTMLGYPERDPRRLGDTYRHAVRSDQRAYEARTSVSGHSVPYDRGNGAQFNQRLQRPVLDEPHGSSTEQGRLFRSAIPRTEDRVQGYGQ